MYTPTELKTSTRYDIEGATIWATDHQGSRFGAPRIECQCATPEEAKAKLWELEAPMREEKAVFDKLLEEFFLLD